jgi:hypothetical protein
MRAYGLHRSASRYEYDHLIPLELGGATNDARNLWPEPGGVPNLKDKVDNDLHNKVCNGAMSLGRAQRIVAVDWVSYYKTMVAKPKPKPAPPPPPPPTPTPTPTPTLPIVHPGAFCSPLGAQGQTVLGTSMSCSGDPARWRHA